MVVLNQMFVVADSPTGTRGSRYLMAAATRVSYKLAPHEPNPHFLFELRRSKEAELFL